jgi:hypothetical protein
VWQGRVFSSSPLSSKGPNFATCFRASQAPNTPLPRRSFGEWAKKHGRTYASKEERKCPFATCKSLDPTNFVPSACPRFLRLFRALYGPRARISPLYRTLRWPTLAARGWRYALTDRPRDDKGHMCFAHARAPFPPPQPHFRAASAPRAPSRGPPPPCAACLRSFAAPREGRVPLTGPAALCGAVTRFPFSSREIPPHFPSLFPRFPLSSLFSCPVVLRRVSWAMRSYKMGAAHGPFNARVVAQAREERTPHPKLAC